MNTPKRPVTPGMALFALNLGTIIYASGKGDHAAYHMTVREWGWVSQDVTAEVRKLLGWGDVELGGDNRIHITVQGRAAIESQPSRRRR